MTRIHIMNLTIIGLLFVLQPAVSWALYFDFEDDAQLKEWETQGDWKIEKDNENGSQVLSGAGNSEVIALVGENSWTDYTVEFEAAGLTDEIAIAFRAQDADNFLSYMVAPSLVLSEWFQKLKGQFNENIGDKGEWIGIQTKEWHTYKLVVEGNTAMMFIDGDETIDPLQLDKLPPDFKEGRVGFRQWSDGALYDNVLITGPGIPVTPGEPGFSVEPTGKLATIWADLKQ